MRKAIIIILLLLPAGARPGDTPVRDGFTLELGIGLGFMHLLPERGEATGYGGMAPLSIGLGGFFNNSMALLFRAAGVSHLERIAGRDIITSLDFYGAHFQYWFDQRFFLSAGPGIAVLSRRYSSDFWSFIERQRGLGLGLRGGFSFANWQNHSLRVSLELFPCFFRDGSAMGEALTFEWQWF